MNETNRRKGAKNPEALEEVTHNHMPMMWQETCIETYAGENSPSNSQPPGGNKSEIKQYFQKRFELNERGLFFKWV